MEDPERFEIKLSPQTESILVSIRVSKKQEQRVFILRNYVTTECRSAQSGMVLLQWIRLLGSERRKGW